MSSSGTEATVLLVEDDSDVREAVADTLEAAGYRVWTARQGLEALEALRGRALRPCLILLDLMMPVMDGWQFREEQARDPALSRIPVVALSAHGSLEGLDVAAYLRKPVELRALIDTVSRFCARNSP